MKHLTILFSLLFIVNYCTAEDYDYPLEDDSDNQSDNQIDNDTVEDIVVMVTKPITFIAAEYSDVILPCQTNSTDDAFPTRLWLKGSTTLFQDKIAITQNRDLKYLENGSLLIENLEKQDEGIYTCRIVSENLLPSVKHVLKVKTPVPEIDEFLAANNETTLQSGAKLLLTCKAFGVPPPVVSWFKITNGTTAPLPDIGERFERKNVTIADAGTYRCVADNRIGNPTSAELKIDVFSCKPSTGDDYNYPVDDDKDMQNDNNDANYYDDIDGVNPELIPVQDEKPIVMLTQSLRIVTIPGQDVHLPCQTNASGEGVTFWYHATKMLFQSGFPTGAAANMRSDANNSLVISSISQEQEGDYECNNVITQKNSAAVRHHVRVLTSPAPVIDDIRVDKDVLSVGDSLKLECLAVGYPAPQITWHKIIDNNTSERLASGGTLVIPNVKHRDSGTYTCLADNKILPLAVKEIHIKVQMKPVVTVEQIFSNSGNTISADLKCMVHAEPPATVVWLRNGEKVVSNAHTQLESKGHNHKLYINDLTDEDFTSYVCSATNSLGKTKKEIKLKKTPTILKFIKPQDGSKDVKLTWELQSKAPISEHEIHYKKKDADAWQRVSPEVKSPRDNDIYVVEHQLQGLEPGLYEAKIRSKNTHGWSEFSEPMPFQGVYAKHGHHNKHNKKPHKESKEKHLSSELPKIDDELNNDKPIPEDHYGQSPKYAASQPSAGCTLRISSVAPLFVGCYLLLATMRL